MNAIPPPTGERLLADAIRRAQRSGNQQLLTLHLGSLPAPRPHHRRIARALLQDAASRHGGQIFPLRNNDLALLTTITDGKGGAIDPANLPATFAELFRADRPDPAGLTSIWNIETDQTEIFQYLQTLLTQEPQLPLCDEIPPPPAAVEDIASLLATARIGDLTQRQIAIEIAPDPAAPGSRGRIMRPLFREITFSVDVLESRLAVTGRASSDPYLFRHLAARLDPRMMEFVLTKMNIHAPGAPRLHINLTIETLVTAEFDEFARQCLDYGHRPGIEVPLIEACRDPDQFKQARDRVQNYGFPLIIEGVSPLGLRLANPGSFGADLVKLNWDKSLAVHATPEMIAAINRLGPERIILQRAQNEQAITFGLGVGITRFQGHHIDAMLAAARLKSCPEGDASHCTLRQCSERAAATSAATRRFCRNQPLLERGMPENLRQSPER